ncbi:hypothetical protein HAHI6034_01140 [Hathewaya histolytica]|uniref:Uncharacterized protein n=1 Tax=Hathewaya histolytica TaxID=1498 RepID=A0A4V6KBR0_HATHI|nr:hypothetical protein [Hathewaya histolytica]VTQ83607.1 Uncharacterised protein [Hathewaya histolytica]
MASWGPKLYQDDVAEDVRDYYKDQLKRGKTNEEVTKELIDDNEDIILDEDEAPVFWFALADTQWNLGRLLSFVKEKALEYLKSSTNLERWEKEAINQREYKVREKVLQELEQKLMSPMPPEKKISQYKFYKCEWNIGDMYAYKLESDYAKEKGLSNRYLLIRKAYNDIWWPGHTVPIIYIQITKDETIPNSREEIVELEYIQTSRSEGFPKYLTTMISTSKRVIPTKKLSFIGNYVDLPTPKDEYIPEDKISLPACHWSAFEKTLIDDYLMFNKNK